MRKLSHFDNNGKINMVDVGDKKETKRGAVAQAKIKISKALMKIIKEKGLPKGDLLSSAKIAGIMAAKSTHNLIPLCHPLVIDKINVDVMFNSEDEISVIAEVKSTGKTGVEMEALSAVSVASLTVYDMCKSFDKSIVISDIRLLEKWGGKSGHFKNKKR